MAQEIVPPFSGSPNAIYYVDGGDDEDNVAEMMASFYSKSFDYNQTRWTESDIDTKVCAGNPNAFFSLYGTNQLFSRNNLSFNRTQRVINMMSGFQRRNRKQIIATAVDERAERGASQWTTIFSDVARRSDLYNYVSDAFEGSIITGFNLLHVWLDHRKDLISGDIAISNYGYNNFIMDPYVRRYDLSDCQFVWTRRLKTRREVKSLLPGREKEINMMPEGYRDTRFTYLPNSYDYYQKDRMAYDEFYYMSTRKAKFLIDAITGECIEFNGKDDQLDIFLREHPQIVLNESMIPSVKMAICVNGHVMYKGPNLLGIDNYPFIPFWCYHNPDLLDFQFRDRGVVRNLRDAQFLYNRFMNLQLDMAEAGVNRGMFYKPDALVDPNDIFLQGNGRGIAIKEEYAIGDAIQQIVAPEIPSSYAQLSQILGAEIAQIAGVSEELLGMADDDKAGILAMARQGASLTTLQKIYDQLDLSLKHIGRLIMDVVTVNYSEGKIQRILTSEEPIAPEIKSRLLNQYDIAVEEGTYTTTQKQLAFIQLFEMVKAGVPIPPSALLEPLTIQDKDKIIAGIQEQSKQQSQLEQNKMQAEIALLQAQIQNLNAQAVANQGLGMERAARVETDTQMAIAHRAKAISDIEQARLDKAKTIREITDIDLEQIRKAIEIQQMIQKKENPEADLEKVASGVDTALQEL